MTASCMNSKGGREIRDGRTSMQRGGQRDDGGGSLPQLALQLHAALLLPLTAW
jgi:hypothetical protein